MTKCVTAILIILLMVSITCGSRESSQKTEGASDFTLRTLDGEEITLSNLKGKVVLIDFWATWCAPCRFAIPHLSDMYKQYKNQGFVVLGISLEDKETQEKFRDDYDVTYPMLLGTREVAQAYNVQAIPKSVFIDKTGKVSKVQVGFAPELAPIFETLVDSLLNE
jgi:peroxiredoxin